MKKIFQRLPLGRGMDVLSYGYAFWINQCTSGFHGLEEPGGSRGSFEVGVGAAEEGKVVYLVFQRQGKERDIKNAVWPDQLMERNEGEVDAETSKTFGFIVTTRDTLVEVGYNNYGLSYKAEVGESDLIRLIEVRDKMMLEVSSWKDVVHLEKKEMLAPIYKYLANTNLHVHLEEIKVDKTFCFVEEPVGIIDREVKSLKRSRIPIVNSIGTRIACRDLEAAFGYPGIELLSDAALLEDAQLKEALKKSKEETHKFQACGSSKGADFESELPNESKAKPSDTSEGTDESDDVNDDDNANDDDSGNKDDDGNDAHDSERTNSDDDDDENPSFTLKDHDEEKHDEEYESDDDNENVYEEEDDDLYTDVDVRSLGAEHEKERKGDEEMTDADQNVSQKKSYEQVLEDAHVTLTSSQKTKSSKQSSSVSFDFASKFLILDNVPPVVDEVASMMNVTNHQKELSTQAPSFFTVPETAIPEISTAHT
ncbi:hypothetical protein Tco_0086048 [Tanacetum coccineum]